MGWHSPTGAAVEVGQGVALKLYYSDAAKPGEPHTDSMASSPSSPPMRPPGATAKAAKSRGARGAAFGEEADDEGDAEDVEVFEDTMEGFTFDSLGKMKDSWSTPAVAGRRIREHSCRAPEPVRGRHRALASRTEVPFRQRALGSRSVPRQMADDPRYVLMGGVASRWAGAPAGPWNAACSPPPCGGSAPQWPAAAPAGVAAAM